MGLVVKWRVFLQCESVEKEGDLFTSRMKLLNQDGSLSGTISVTTDDPMVPGHYYEFRLYGMFPPHCNNQPCSSNVVHFISKEGLTAVDKLKLPEKIRENIFI
jgi:hypothetical protein